MIDKADCSCIRCAKLLIGGTEYVYRYRKTCLDCGAVREYLVDRETGKITYIEKD